MTAARTSAKADAEHARQQQAEHTQVIDACRELATLWPHLTSALARDTASSGANPTNHATNPTPTLVNHDVAQAVTEIQRWLISTRAECRRILCLNYRGNVFGVLEAIPVWHHHLQQLNLPTAGYLAADATHALTTARRALRLTEQRRFAGTCPNHPETRTPLILTGRDGALDETLVNGSAIRCTDGTWRIPAGAITWRRGVTVQCPRCHTAWSDPAQLLILARRLTEQDSI